ncbi:MAG: sigma-70 family RNA polymerase sigma factor [Pseudomonadota bacterium]
MSHDDAVTGLLARWSDGDEQALNELTPIVYDELKKLARSAFRREHGAHTLQATALVNEAYVQLVGADVNWKGRSHFFALAARMMRRILVNHANAKAAEKRGGDRVQVTLHETSIADSHNAQDVIDLDKALAELATHDERTAEIVQLHYFGGMTYEEAGAALGVSQATAKRSLRFGKAWMRDYLDRHRGE